MRTTYTSFGRVAKLENYRNPNICWIHFTTFHHLAKQNILNRYLAVFCFYCVWSFWVFGYFMVCWWVCWSFCCCGSCCYRRICRCFSVFRLVIQFMSASTSPTKTRSLSLRSCNSHWKPTMRHEKPGTTGRPASGAAFAIVSIRHRGLKHASVALTKYWKGWRRKDESGFSFTLASWPKSAWYPMPRE